MATYRDLITKLESGKVHKLTWLCGSQPALVEEAITAIRLTLNPHEMNAVTLFAGQDSAGDIFTEMSQHAIDPTMPRLVTVRDAEKLGSSLAKLDSWIQGTKYANVHVVMASNLAEWKTDFMPEVRKRVVGSTTSLYVECKLSKTEPEAQAAQLIADFWCPKLSYELAEVLARTTGCDLARCRDVAKWINVLEGFRPTMAGIEKLAKWSSMETYADALTSLDRAKACELARDMDAKQTSSSLGRLQRNLTDLEAINRAMKPVLARINDRTKVKMAIGETARAAGLPLPTVIRLWDVARHYDGTSVSRRTEALIRADQHRNDVGALEALAMEW